MTDPRPSLFRALDQMDALIAATQTDRLAAPTPCEGWDVRTLLSHVVTVYRRTALAPAGRALEVAHVSDVADGGHVAAARTARADIEAAWADDDVLDREVPVPWGTVPGRQVALGFRQELVVHAWDLAVAVDGLPALDPTSAEETLELARRILPADGRGARFGAVVAVPDDAPAPDRLAGWLGRDPAAARR